MFRPARPHRRIRAAAVSLALSCGALTLVGCDRGGSGDAPARHASLDERERVPPPPVKPEYHFAEELHDQYPDIVAFMRHFLETCLAGDYAGYRKLVSRRADPESRERFQTVLHAIRALRINSINRLERPGATDDVYLVVSEVQFHPESKVRLRRKTNQVGVLVFKEEGQWRVMPAPAELQPTDEPDATESAPASAPSYPWDEDGDF